MHNAKTRLYFVAFRLPNNALGTFNKVRELIEGDEWKGVELKRLGWLVNSERSALELFMDVAPMLERQVDQLLIAEITANTFGTHVDERNLEITALIGGARHD
jgi:hypothetical protein